MGHRLAPIGMGLFAIFLVTFVLGLGTGYRTHVLTTPSMGKALPVGTMIVTKPTPVSDVAVGDIVTYRVGGDMTRTHRVVATSPSSLTTRGDLNGSNDPAPVKQSDLVGKVIFSWRYGGWILRTLPYAAGGWLLMHVASRRLPAPAERSRYRSLGVFCGISIALALYKPLFGVEMLTMKMDGEGAHATATVHAVSTGMLPIQLDGVGDNSTPSEVLTTAGADGFAVARTPNDAGRFEFRPKPVFSPSMIALLVAAAGAPYVWFYGLHLWHRRHVSQASQRQKSAVGAFAHPGSGAHRA
ncbi:signal peptidase I [Corynebacterium epidermidicanis]|uniref:Signal peptidase I n=1 Tax=Corynebacterium epidermidicanis TaxID=1050174 RepID=A0A0G3GNK9_9CORY|nr:signal peptidase I [Corynebacterium epidermidicanis]AKK02125.1 signal peptidase I [Corynebacterium epidermidicanis]